MDDLGLTPELQKMTTAFAAIGDDKLRYKQLLYMANQLDPMDDALKIPEHKVIGCLSNVYIHATTKVMDDDDDDKIAIQFTGDSDGLLTKGLVALLVRGLSGCTAEEIQLVNPRFIQTAGIQSSLTPGRNNGFLNMLAQMKQQALELASSSSESTSTESSSSSQAVNGETAPPESLSISDDRPMYTAMIQALQKLQPTQLELKDVSYQHAGHAGSKGFDDGESHFELTIVSQAFEGLKLVKRHQLIYLLLGDIMPRIHALQITAAQTPSEAAERQGVQTKS